MAEEHEEPSGPDEELERLGFGHQDEDWDAVWADPKGSRGRILIGIGLLLVGIVIAVLAVTQLGSDDDEPSASKTEVQAATSKPKATTTTTIPPTTIVPTTLPAGALPTGCGNWDAAFSFDPDPIEGVVIYSDFEGWHVLLGPGGPKVLAGTVVGQTTPLVSTAPPGPGVQVLADPATNTVHFNLTAGDEPVGFDFAADCTQKQLTFDLKDQDGAPVDPAVVHLGRGGGTTTVPVVAQRQQPPPG